ncbi:MAG: tetratricopeptide repeat protein [Candidatus Omnitrophica bacterium]|nr:tetratricopeptide repeat protein [Candidatus Omnitrophota bacterium]
MKTKPSLLKLILFVTGLALVTTSCDNMKSMAQKVMYNRARNLHDHGKVSEAIEVYKRVLESDGDNSEVHYDLGVAYADNQEISNAKKQVAILRKLDRSDLAEVLETVIRDANSARVRKKLQADYDSGKEQ